MLDMLERALGLFIERCVRGIEADRDACRRNLESGYTLAVALTGSIGYDRASEVASECRRTGRTVLEVVLEKGLMDKKTLDAMLQPEKLTAPGNGKEERGWT